MIIKEIKSLKEIQNKKELSVSEVSLAVNFLISEKSSGITGQIIHVITEQYNKIEYLSNNDLKVFKIY